MIFDKRTTVRCQIACLLFLIATIAFAPTSFCALPKIRIAKDGHTFQTEDAKPFIPFGVTYYRPGTGWAPQVWKQFDASATERDFQRMKEAGVNCVRVFLSYGSFCMQPGILDPEGLAKFDRFLEIAEKAGIYIHPTGPDHWEGTPEWAAVDRIADEQSLSGLEKFWQQFAARYRGRSVIYAYDLRNEPEVAWDTPPMREKWLKWVKAKYKSDDQAFTAWTGKTHGIQEMNAGGLPDSRNAPSLQSLDYQLFREDLADEWTRRQVAAIKRSDPDALVTVGLIQWSVPALLPAVKHYSGFRPARQAALLDFLEIHFYPFADGPYEYRNLEEEERNLAYLESVVSETARPGKPVVVAEFGWYGGGKPKFDNGRHPAATEEQQARWCRRLVESTAGLAVGWLNWGFYDQPEATDVSELTGLFTAEGKAKAWAREFRGLATHPPDLAPGSNRGSRPTLDWDRCLTSLEDAAKFREQYYKAWKRDLTAR